MLYEVITYNSTLVFSNGVVQNGAQLTVSSGVSSFTVTVTTINDALVDAAYSETLPMTVGGITATGHILDDDVPTISDISLVTASVPEGADLVYTVTLSATTTSALDYDYSLGGGTAAAGTDYNATPAFSNGVTQAGALITVPSGISSFTVTVTTLADGTVETNFEETLPLTIGGVTDTGYIQDADLPTVTDVSLVSDPITEGDDLVYTVTLSATTNQTTGFTYSLGGGTAVEDLDYSLPATFSNGVTLNGDVSVPAGVSSFTVTISTIYDPVVDTVYEVTLPLTVGGVSATAHIHDADLPTINTVSLSPDTVTEGDNLYYTVSLSATTNQNTDFSFAISGTATSGTDYNATPVFSNGVTLDAGTITVPSGVSSFTVTITTLADSIVDDAFYETVIVTIGGISGTGHIEDSDSPTVNSITLSPDTVTEGGNLVYTVLLSTTTNTATDFSYSLGGGTATADVDYNSTPSFSNGVTLVTNTITVPSGVLSFTVTVATIDDQDVDSASDETLPLTIGGVTGTGHVITSYSIHYTKLYEVWIVTW